MKKLLLVMVTILVTGCVSTNTGASWISASRFNYLDYQDKNIAVMPLMLAGTADLKDALADQIQQTLTRQLSVLELSNTIDVPLAAAASIEFPYTPGRLAEFAREQNKKRKPDEQYAAVVAGTIIRITRRTQFKQWSMTGNITFVDVNNPSRMWTVARTWDFNGEPVAGLTAKIQMSTAFQRDLLEVRRATKRGAFQTLLGRDTVVVEGGTILNLDLTETTVTDSKKSTQVIARPTEGNSSTTLVDIFAIDDRGIRSLWVRNDHAEDKQEVFGPELQMKRMLGIFEQRTVTQKAPLPDEKSPQPKPPVYLADRVPIKLRPGVNDIEATVVNVDGTAVKRSVRVNVDIAAVTPVEMLVVAPTLFESSDVASLKVDELARLRFDDLRLSTGASSDGTQRVYMFVDEDATRSGFLRGVIEEWAWERGDTGGRRVLSFTGRAEMLFKEPYLLLHDSEPRYPDIGSIPVKEFLDLVRYRVNRVSLEVCTDASESEFIRQAIDGEISKAKQQLHLANVNFEVVVTPDCAKPIGAQFLKVSSEELRDAKQ